MSPVLVGPGTTLGFKFFKNSEVKMIEIKFTGGPGSIHGSIRSYLDQAGEAPVTKVPSPLVHYVGVDSNTDQYAHIITMLGQFPLACTCSWFRHNHDSAKQCHHMTEAAEDARS